MDVANQAVAATVTGGASSGGGGPGGAPTSPAGLRAMLDSLLAADAGPPPALAPLQALAPAVQGVAAHAAQQAITNATALLRARGLAAAPAGLGPAAAPLPPAAQPLAPLPAAPASGWVPQSVPLPPPAGQALLPSPVAARAQQAPPAASPQLAEQPSEALLVAGRQQSWESDGGGVLLPIEGLL